MSLSLKENDTASCFHSTATANLLCAEAAQIVTAQASSAATSAITSLHSPSTVCRNSRALGYHGLSFRSIIHRQSGLTGSKIQTGFPSAPAKCATEVSTVTIRSRSQIAAAVSAKSPVCG